MPKPKPKTDLQPSALQRPQKLEIIAIAAPDLAKEQSEPTAKVETIVDKPKKLKLDDKISVKPVIQPIKVKTSKPVNINVAEVEPKQVPQVLSTQIQEHSIQTTEPQAAIKEPSQELPAEINLVNFPCQAVGSVFGKYIPSEVFGKGHLLSDKGVRYTAYVLAKALKPMQKKMDLSLSHSYLVYPKTNKLDTIHFDILAVDTASKMNELDCDRFNIRGQIIGQFVQNQTKPSEPSTETNDVSDVTDETVDTSNPENISETPNPSGFLLIQIQRNPNYLKSHHREQFVIKILGVLPENLLKQFVCIKSQLINNHLQMISYEHLACPLPLPRPNVIKPILVRERKNHKQAEINTQDRDILFEAL